MLTVTAALALLLAQDAGAGLFERSAQAVAQGDYAAAERDLQLVLQRAPAHTGALGNLGIVYARTGRLPEAVATYQKALRTAPNEPGLLLNLALAYLQLEEYGKAKPLLARLSTFGKPSAQVRELTAAVQLHTGETRAALQTLEDLNRADPASAGVLYLMALGYLRQGDRATAAIAFDNLLRVLTPGQAHLLAGRAYYETALFEEAERELRQAPDAHLELGKTYTSLRRTEDAVREFRAELARTPSNIEAQYYLGALLIQDEATALEGDKLLAEVQRRRPDSWGAHYYRGKRLWQQRRVPEAITALEKAAALNGAEASIWIQLAQAYRAASRPADAQRAATRAASLKQSAQAPLVIR